MGNRGIMKNMKSLLISCALLLVFVQLPFSPFAPDKPEEKKIESPVKGWWMVSYFAVPPTRYAPAGKGIIKAESLGSRASLFKRVQDKEKDFSTLAWKWKISNVVRSAIETRKDRFDAAACIMVIFGKEGFFGVNEGMEPRGLKIEYIWATRLPRGHVFDHPGEGNCKVFVLESGEKKVGEWVLEQRNLSNDFRMAFGTEPPDRLAIGLQTDTDHSNERVTAFYSEPVLRKK
jgi:hypothetical protein